MRFILERRTLLLQYNLKMKKGVDSASKQANFTFVILVKHKFNDF